VGNFNLPLMPVPGKRLVLTVHDLIPELFPHTVSAAFRWQFRLWLRRSLRIVDHVLCVSETTAADLLRLHPEAAGVPLTVVHHGVDHVPARARDPGAAAWVDQLGLPAETFLYAGALDARKNIALLLDAGELLWRSGWRGALVLVGQRWFGSEPIEARIAQLQREGRDVRVLGHQPDARLHALMARTTAFVFPSRYEGFGLPPLEAMRLGAPTVVTRAGALPEVCGEAALQVSPEDPEELVAALRRLLQSPEERRWWAEAGRRRASELTWQRTAQKTIEAYHAALQE
jgi:glycosyltransferase involved in cell wall biosynthesis